MWSSAGCKQSQAIATTILPYMVAGGVMLAQTYVFIY
jgi:hypothetical protein